MGQNKPNDPKYGAKRYEDADYTPVKCELCGRPYANGTALAKHKTNTGLFACKGK
jgi:hypothetical protein